MKRKIFLFTIGFLIGYFTSREVRELLKTPEIISPLPESKELIRYENPKPTTTPSFEKPSELHNQGKASFYTTEYCQKYNPSCLTANGDLFTDTAFTCACDRNIPLGSEIRITYNQKTITVICNDRGSFSEKYGRTFDLSKAAFEALSPLSKGVINITFEVI
jgi:rare lipoprotein A